MDDRYYLHVGTVIHYHGTPITPKSELLTLAGRNFCVSYAAPNQVQTVHEIGQSVMLDNGAFTFWKKVQEPSWHGYVQWAAQWLDYPTTWAVIPDIIDGVEEENDDLIEEWLNTDLPKGAPVWHMHESVERLLRLCDTFERVCVGSSGLYSAVGSDSWHRRMTEAMNAVCGSGPVPVWLHMLRGMSLSGSEYPFASVDSTDIARNHHLPHKNARAMADRWDGLQCPARWQRVELQQELEGVV